MVDILIRRAAPPAALIWLALSAPALALPTILTAPTADTDMTPRLQERPATIFHTESNVRTVAGSFNGMSPSGGPDLGPLVWATYTESEATAAGIAYVQSCTVYTCLDRPFVSVPATVRAFEPVNGTFTRLTITYEYFGRRVVEHTHVELYPDDIDGRRSHWGYVVDRTKYTRCGKVRYRHRQTGRGAGVVRANLDNVTCPEALAAARRGASRVIDIGSSQPAPKGWRCSGGFRPTVQTPRPDAMGCRRHHRSSAFEESMGYFGQVWMRY